MMNSDSLHSIQPCDITQATATSNGEEDAAQQGGTSIGDRRMSSDSSMHQLHVYRHRQSVYDQGKGLFYTYSKETDWAG